MRCPHAVLNTDTAVYQSEARPGCVRVPAWLWPNVMSLDAPAIAVLWQLLLAHAQQVRLDWAEPLVLGLAVWAIYLSDQILDAFRPAAGAWEATRKKFYRRHAKVAAAGGAGLVCLVVPLAWRWLTPATFRGGVGLGIPVVGYFVLVHLTPAQWRACWPREAAVGLLFALGTFLGVWAANGRQVQPVAAPALLFGLLCWANCSAIESWEWQRSRGEAAGIPSSSARWAAEHLPVFAMGIALLAASLGFVSVVPLEFAVAAFWSGIALALLGTFQSQLSVSVTRVAADAALTTPLLALLSVWLR